GREGGGGGPEVRPGGGPGGGGVGREAHAGGSLREGVEQRQHGVPPRRGLVGVLRVPVVGGAGEGDVVLAGRPAEHGPGACRVEDEGRVGEQVVFGDEGREAEGPAGPRRVADQGRGDGHDAPTAARAPERR